MMLISDGPSYDPLHKYMYIDTQLKMIDEINPTLYNIILCATLRSFLFK